MISMVAHDYYEDDSIRNMLTDDACSQLIHSLVTVRIDYCNSLLYGMPDSTLFDCKKF